jgi:glutaminyl-tRNA synthetase
MSDKSLSVIAPAPDAQIQHFIRSIIEADLASGKHSAVATRFPPEPNGYLHVGHAKSICLNFGLAQDYQGTCNLRFDDTNPEKESEEYALAIQEDVRWLGFEWNGEVRWASDYFQALYDYAEELIRQGKAYVCDLTPEEMRTFRGTLTEPGRPSPHRDRSPGENLDLFRRMKAGEFPDGAKTLRARIDMASPNINLRDPVIYRIKRAHHIRTGDQWCIYPMYDYTHCISDALECITHSLCTLEFEDHRPLYDWVLDQLPVPCHPAPDRVLPPGTALHHHQQAQAPATGEPGHRFRLGRPAHAHHPRHAPARLHARGHPRIRPPHRHFQERERR